MEAEKSIRLHFEMEQIVYCQDREYRGALKKVREQEAEEEKKNKRSGFEVLSHESTAEFSMAEIFQHLTAYRQVGLQMSLRMAASIVFSSLLSASLISPVVSVREHLPALPSALCQPP